MCWHDSGTAIVVLWDIVYKIKEPLYNRTIEAPQNARLFFNYKCFP